MTVKMTAAQKEHYEKVMKELSDDLTKLQLKYDSKYLAVALLTKAVWLMQLLQAAKVWSQDEVSVIVQAAFADVHEVVKSPTIMTIDPSNPTPQPRAS